MLGPADSTGTVRCRDVTGATGHFPRKLLATEDEIYNSVVAEMGSPLLGPIAESRPVSDVPAVIRRRDQPGGGGGRPESVCASPRQRGQRA